MAHQNPRPSLRGAGIFARHQWGENNGRTLRVLPATPCVATSTLMARIDIFSPPPCEGRGFLRTINGARTTEERCAFFLQRRALPRAP